MNINASLSISESTVSDLEMRGVTLRLFQAIRKHALSLNSEKGYWSMGRISAQIIGNHWILEGNNRWSYVDPGSTLTFEDRCSLIDLLERKYSTGDVHPILELTYDEVDEKANVFISFAYYNDFITLVDALENFFENYPSYSVETTFFWFDIFVNNQWEANTPWESIFKNAVESIGMTVGFFEPWNNPICLTRIWCGLELAFSPNVIVILSKQEEKSFMDGIRNDTSSYLQMLATVNTSKCEALNLEDTLRIEEAIKGKLGGFASLDSSLLRKIEGWMVDVLLKQIASCENSRDEIEAAAWKQSLGLLYYEQSEYRQAEVLFSDVYATRARLLGLTHADTLATMYDLGWNHGYLGKLLEAQDMLEKCFEGRKSTLVVDHVDTLQSMNGLGSLYNRQQIYDKAEEMLIACLAGRKRTLGDDHTATLSTMNNLGVLYRDQKRFDEAEEIWIACLKGRKRTLGDDHSLTLKIMCHLGSLHRDQERYDEAEEMWIKCWEVQKRILGDYHDDTNRTAGNLGDLYRDQKRFDKAEEMWIVCLEGQKKTLNDDHADTLDTMYNLGNLYHHKKRYDKAEEMWIACLEGWKRTLNDDHAATLAAMNSLGLLYRGQKIYDKAEEMLIACLEGKKRTLGDDHADTLRTKNNLGLLYRDQKRFDEAEEMCGGLHA
jgi:tetratricopeptide (TPR) repeat protein